MKEAPSQSVKMLMFQGLDVVIFSVLKRHWTTARDTFERTKGIRVDKTNFLSVYAEAHLAALSTENITAAFRKTGVVPFNPDVVTSEMMAPSTETSIQGALPTRQTTPIRTITRLLSDEINSRAHCGSGNASDTRAQTPPRTPARAQDVMDALRSTAASFLVSPSPVSADSLPPRYLPSIISPMKRRYQVLLSQPPATRLEHRLQEALAESEERDHLRKGVVVDMQAATILQGLYVDRVQEKLQVQKDKEGRKRRKLLSDGLPRLLDGDEFFSRVVEHDAEQEQDKAEKDARKAGRKRYQRALKRWKRGETERKERVAAQRTRYKEAMVKWEREKQLPKQQRQAAAMIKPLLGPIERALPKPTLASTREKENAEESESEEDESEEDEDEEDEDEDMDLDN